MLRGDPGRSQSAVGIALIAGIGVLAAVLVLAGNPGNMGLCGACFLRDLGGALHLHSGPAIFRPEMLGIVLGALLWSALARRHIGRSGGFAVARFLLCVAMAFGALVFLGCPFRLLQRLGGGDLHAWAALPGLVLGVGIARWFERGGVSPGKTQEAPLSVGLLGPLTFAALLFLFVGTDVLLGPGPGEDGKPAHAPWLLSLGLALPAGGILSATGFCVISAARQVFSGPRGMLLAATLLVAAYGLVLALAGQAQWSMGTQPVAHGDWVWNTLALVLVGLCGAFAGGCPVRQLVMAGEGNGDAFVGVCGLVVGGALAHGLSIASAAASAETVGGVSFAGKTTVAIAIPLVLIYGLALRRGPAATPP
jgi:YedE family putative selenium metabolism protein